MIEGFKGMDVSLTMFLVGIFAFLSACIIYLFLWEVWSKSGEALMEYYVIYTVWNRKEEYGSKVILATEDEEEAKMRFHLIRTVSEIYFSKAAIVEQKDGISISKGDCQVMYLMQMIEV